MREAAHGVDGLLGQVVVGFAVVLARGLAVLVQQAGAHPVHLLVELGAVVEAVLAGAGHGVGHAGGMPCANARDLAQTLVRLARQLGGAPAVGHTLKAVALGHAQHINHLVLLKHGAHGHLLLQVLLSVRHLVGHAATVDLDLHQVRLLLSQVDLVNLGVGEHTHDRAVLGDALQLVLKRLLVRGHLLGVLGERLLLGLAPVLVEAATQLVRQMLSPHRGQGAQTAGGLDVAHNTHNDHGRRLHNADGLDDLLLVRLGAGTIQLAHNVGHAGLVAHERCQVRLLLRVVLREGAHAAADVLAALAGQEGQRALAGARKLSVRHLPGCEKKKKKKRERKEMRKKQDKRGTERDATQHTIVCAREGGRVSGRVLNCVLSVREFSGFERIHFFFCANL
eukprot:m.40748 g.40748  ORF g.40748 m.40748 type:complete len:394 (-) comp14147_c0_seq1:75-1256(-)